MNRLSAGIHRSGFDVVTAMILLNVAVFIYQERLIGTKELWPFLTKYSLSYAGLNQGYYWQWITHMFLHGGVGQMSMRLIHIGFNMFVVYSAGKALLYYIGPWHFLGLYFISGVFGGLLQLIIVPSSFLLGASGAAFGLLVAFCALHPTQVLRVFIIAVPLKMRGRTFGRAILISSLVLGIVSLVVPAMIPMVSNIGHFAHLGGGLAGFAYMSYFGFRPKPLTKDDLAILRDMQERKMQDEGPAPLKKPFSDSR